MTFQSSDPNGLNYEPKWKKVLGYAAMPITIPMAAAGFLAMAVKYAFTGKSDGNGPA